MNEIQTRARGVMRGIAFILFVLGTSDAYRQDGSITKNSGFEQNRDYLGLQPFETVDTGGGNVLLTFTDMVLPGNGGRELRFGRIYNNQNTNNSTLFPWRFSISGDVGSQRVLSVAAARPSDQGVRGGMRTIGA